VKSYTLVTLILAINSLSFALYSQGTVDNHTFYSKSLNMNRQVQVYLPEAYNQMNPVRYPVIYFLHGAGQNSTSVSELFTIFNTSISSNTISPVIVVKPDGSTNNWGGGSWYANSERLGNFEDYIVYDLIAFIDSAYNTINSREKRAIMGYSMGGFGAMKFALKHPEIFCAVASHSGPLDMIQYSLYIPTILSENGGAPVSTYDPNAGPWTKGAFALSAAFSPNLNNPPHYVDFPLDSQGNWIDSVWNRWAVHNCALLAKNITQDDDLAIYFDCGKQDETQAYAFNTSFVDSLDKLDLPYEFQSYTGGHTIPSNRYAIGLAFLDSVINKTSTAIENKVDIDPASFILFQNYPNPFNPTTTIPYTLSQKAQVNLCVYDLLGREIQVLVSSDQPAGAYQVIFNGENLAAGVYIYQLQAELDKGNRHVEMKKLILIK
jgi:enterochelin esterase-like enzyme